MERWYLKEYETIFNLLDFLQLIREVQSLKVEVQDDDAEEHSRGSATKDNSSIKFII